MVLSDLLAGHRIGSVPPSPYTLTDMAGDAICLLDHLGVDAAHVVGVSMGGMIAQRMAYAYPEHVRTLTLVMTSTGDPALPGATPEAAQALFAPAPTDREGYIAASLARRTVLGSPGFPQDEQWLRTVIGQAYDRGLNPAGFLRQYHAILADGDRTQALGQISVPTLVVHGAEDPLIPLAAGRATAEAIPGAVLQVVQGMGHDLPSAVCELLAGWVRDLVAAV
jgi:pimeloyl-ACP methyl ester carboxylesterase